MTNSSHPHGPRFGDHRNNTPRRDPILGPPANFCPTENIESASEATSFVSTFDGYTQSSNTSTYWSTTDQQRRSDRTRSLAPGTFFPDRVRASEIPARVQVHSTVPFNYQGGSQSGHSTSAFGRFNFIPTRVWPTPNGRFEPYPALRPRATEQWNAETDPSFTHVILPPLQYTMDVTPEAAADAETNNPITEVPSRRARGTGRYRKSRVLEQQDIRELCDLVQQWKNLAKYPTRRDALAYTLAYIATVREAVYQHPRLATRECRPNAQISDHARKEQGRRFEERRFFEELSRYYEVDGEDQPEAYEAVWERPPLLKEVLEDLKVRYPPPGLFTSSAL